MSTQNGYFIINRHECVTTIVEVIQKDKETGTPEQTDRVRAIAPHWKKNIIDEIRWLFRYGGGKKKEITKLPSQNDESKVNFRNR